MPWKKIDVVFKLKSPLHIGYLPFRGSVVSPTRYYVLGKNFWGSITKRITEYLYKSADANNYREIGKQVMENFRFSYFYLYDSNEQTIFFPQYTAKGLKYGSLPVAKFEYRFISSIISTAIEKTTKTAEDSTLHEIEFIKNKFKDKNGEIQNSRIIGSIWVKKDAKITNKNIITNNNGIFIDNFNVIKEHILGGESKYGFGHVILDSINQNSLPDFRVFDWVDPENINAEGEAFLYAHLKYDPNLKFEGDIELLTGRGYFDPKKLDGNENKKEDEPGKVLSSMEYYLSPGTRVKNLDKSLKFSINWDGTMNLKK